MRNFFWDVAYMLFTETPGSVQRQLRALVNTVMNLWVL